MSSISVRRERARGGGTHGAEPTACGEPGRSIRAWVIDAKRHAGKAHINKPLLGEAKLVINGRDRSVRIDGLTREVQLVAASLAGISPDVPIVLGW